MKLFTNDYNTLRQNNIDESIQLTASDRTALERMTKYLSANNISLFELEVMKKDLIGIAREAEASDATFTEFLGQSEKEFCDSLLGGALRKNLFEQPLILIKKIFFTIFGFNTFFFFMLGFPKDTGIYLSTLVYAAFFVLIDELIRKKLASRLYGKRYKTAYLIFFLLYWILLDSWIVFSPPDVYLFHTNGWLITLILALIAALMFFANNYYWNTQSKKYNWQ